MRRRLVRAGAWTAGLALAALVLAASGAIPIAASSGHWAVTRWFLELAMRRSVAVRALGTDVPELDDERLRVRGAGHYELGCRPCHGAPGAARGPLPLAMTPTPPDLARTAPGYADAELHWLVLHGIKMTGMPAWPAPERDDEAWALVAFLRALPGLDEAGYRALVVGEISQGSPAARCAGCHGADGLGRGGVAPVIAGQSAEYLEASLHAFAAGERASGFMQVVAAALDGRTRAELARHFAALPGPRAAPAEPAAAARGAAIATDGVPGRRVPSCADCHGPAADGAQARAVYPRLAGQHADYLAHQLRLFADGRRGGTEFAELMRVVAHGLAPGERDDVAAYYAALGAPAPDGR